MILRHQMSYVPWRLIFITLTVLLIAGFLYIILPAPDNPAPMQIVASDEDFTVTAEYQGNENWHYTVTGVLPNRCITHDTATEVVGSDPQKVNVTLFLYSPDDQSLCAQQAQEVQIDGTYTAKSDHHLTFTVDNQISKETPTGLPKKEL